jgi:hypothetical protein
MAATDTTPVYSGIKQQVMDTQNPSRATRQPDTRPGEPNRSGRILGGLLIVVVGVIFLAQKAGADFPHWLFSLDTLLIALGLYVGFRHSFKGIGWFVPMFIGGVLLLDDIYPYYDLSEYTWPLLLIGFGLFIMLRPARRRHDWRKWDEAQTTEEDSADDYLDSTVIFGGVKRNIISKNFRGGETVTVFGGTELNLMQADFTGTIVLDLTQIFGGTKLIVPSHWKIHSKELVAILGGVDDKRPILNSQVEDNNNVLILKGTCLLGGIDIRSY